MVEDASNTVTIKTLVGRSHNISVDKNTTVGQLKQKIADESVTKNAGHPDVWADPVTVDQIILIWGGKQLGDSEQLVDCKNLLGDAERDYIGTIHFVLNLKARRDSDSNTTKHQIPVEPVIQPTQQTDNPVDNNKNLRLAFLIIFFPIGIIYALYKLCQYLYRKINDRKPPNPGIEDQQQDEPNITERNDEH